MDYLAATCCSWTGCYSWSGRYYHQLWHCPQERSTLRFSSHTRTALYLAEECGSSYQEELGGSLDGTEITYDKPEEDTRRGALAVQAVLGDDESAIELNGTIINLLKIDQLTGPLSTDKTRVTASRLVCCWREGQGWRWSTYPAASTKTNLWTRCWRYPWCLDFHHEGTHTRRV